MSKEATLLHLLKALGKSLARQRELLESNQLDDLAQINGDLEQGYATLEASPGGFAALRDEIEAKPEAQRIELLELLGQLRADNRVSGELIRIAMHRVATVRALQLEHSKSSTYGPGASMDPGSRLSRHA